MRTAFLFAAVAAIAFFVTIDIPARPDAPFRADFEPAVMDGDVFGGQRQVLAAKLQGAGDVQAAQISGVLVEQDGASGGNLHDGAVSRNGAAPGGRVGPEFAAGALRGHEAGF